MYKDSNKGVGGLVVLVVTGLTKIAYCRQMGDLGMSLCKGFQQGKGILLWRKWGERLISCTRAIDMERFTELFKLPTWMSVRNGEVVWSCVWVQGSMCNLLGCVCVCVTGHLCAEPHRLWAVAAPIYECPAFSSRGSQFNPWCVSHHSSHCPKIGWQGSSTYSKVFEYPWCHQNNWDFWEKSGNWQKQGGDFVEQMNRCDSGNVCGVTYAPLQILMEAFDRS